jgi:hypothetical protein
VRGSKHPIRRDCSPKWPKGVCLVPFYGGGERRVAPLKEGEGDMDGCMHGMEPPNGTPPTIWPPPNGGVGPPNLGTLGGSLGGLWGALWVPPRLEGT